MALIIAFNHFSTALVARTQRLIATVRDPYRPELHYMRGPGPKWHARHGAAVPVRA